MTTSKARLRIRRVRRFLSKGLPPLFTILIPLISFSAEPGEERANGTIRVVGEGTVEVSPDMAHVTFGVVSESELVSNAVAQNSEAVAKVIGVLKEQGIAERDLQTVNFDISPLNRHDPSGQRSPEIVGYRVTNQISAKVRKLSDLGKLLDAGVRAGANQIHGIRMSVSDPAKRLDEARKKAMEDARHRAEVYAESVQAVVGRAVEISELTSSPPEPFPHALRMADAESVSVPIETGEQSLTARVTVTFALDTERASGSPGS